MELPEKPAVIGLGYVGLPLAVALGRVQAGTIGFDVSPGRVEELRQGQDSTGETLPDALAASDIHFTCDPADLAAATFYIVAVPTPVTPQRQPDLSMVEGASHTVGRVLKAGDVVVYESTVYPGVTEDCCAPVLERESGLVAGRDFGLGYSPERINPGDKQHTLESIVKVVAGDTPETLERVAALYESIVPAGVFRASSIRVAEAAKVIENTQRDVNIALMNELAMIFDRMGIRTTEVLQAARTKWNFLPFRPGLVGGHCIGVDPYYLASAAETVGIHPDMILSGRRTNSGMGEFVARKTAKLLHQAGHQVAGARVAILGMTFKENIPDYRNSQAPQIISELREYGVQCFAHDPMVDEASFRRSKGIELVGDGDLAELDGIVLAVPHRAYIELGAAGLGRILRRPGVLVDVTSALKSEDIPEGIRYWSL